MSVNGQQKILEEVLEVEDLQSILRAVHSFAKHPENPVLTTGPSGAWDDESVEAPSCAFRSPEDGKFWVYYHAYGAHYKIGIAYSDDLISWTKEDTNPVLEYGPESWDKQGVYDAQVLKVGDTYHMYYGGASSGWEAGAIGHATSSNGVDWTKDDENPVVTLPGDPIMSPTRILRVDNEWRLYLHANKKNYLATSSNGVDWSLYGVVLGKGPFNSFLNQGTVKLRPVRLGENFWIGFFTGNNYSHHQEVGMCFSTDGKHWVRHPTSVISRDPEGWAGENVVFTEPLFFRDKIYLLYGADKLGTHTCRMGLAEAKIGGGVESGYFKNGDVGRWNDVSIDAGDTTYGIPTLGYGDISIKFLSDTAGTLTVQILAPDWSWKDYDTVSASADELETYNITGRTRGVRLKFDTAATVSAWYDCAV